MTNKNKIPWYDRDMGWKGIVGWGLGIILLAAGIIALVNYLTKKPTKDNFHFEVTPAKKCSQGPYMTQSGKNHELCKKMWDSKEGRDQIAKYSCLNSQCCGSGLGEGINMGDQWGSGLYVGRPLHFERTPMSNHLWQNEMCNPPILQKDHPSVL